LETDELASTVRLGIEALRSDRTKEALDYLLIAAEHPEFQKQSDMRDLYARVLSLLGQCYLNLNEPQKAQQWIHKALRLLKELDDADGIKEVQLLNNQVLTGLIQRRKEEQMRQQLLKIADTSVEELLSTAITGQEKASVLIEKANAEFEAKRPTEAIQFAEEALTYAKSDNAGREIVLALLSIARSAPEQAHDRIYEAWTVADGENEHNLVSMIAVAAAHAGVDLPSLHGPGGELA
jgi:tetratricopeptide (TPR) repeat protein